MNRDVASETKGLSREKPQDRPSITGGSSGVTTSDQTVFRGRRDPTVPVGDEVEVTVDGEPLDCRYDLLSASPSGLEYGYGGSGPAQLAVAMRFSSPTRMTMWSRWGFCYLWKQR